MSGKSLDIRIDRIQHQHRAYPKGSSPTGCGNGIDTFVVVDVQSLLRGQPMSRNRLADEPLQSNTFKTERKSSTEIKEKFIYYSTEKTFKKLKTPERWSQC